MRSEGSRLLGAVDMTQLQIARRVGVSRTTVAMWVRGDRVPNPEHREALRAAFGIPVRAWPDEWTRIRDVIVEKLASRAPELLLEIVEVLERDIGK